MDTENSDEPTNSVEIENSKRAADSNNENFVPESKRPKLTNGSGDSSVKETVTSAAAGASIAAAASVNDNDAQDAGESSSKTPKPAAESGISVVVISEGDDPETDARDDEEVVVEEGEDDEEVEAVAIDDSSLEVVDADDEDEEEEEEEDDEEEEGDSDDSDCQIVGVSQRVPALPRSDVEYVQHLRERGLNPRGLLSNLLGTDMTSFQATDDALWQLLLRLVSEPARRRRLDNVSTLDDVVVLLATCQRILVLTGAGVSVSCGIPDFRSRDGIYSRLSKEYPELPDPHAMFDIHYFRQDQRPFFKFAKAIYPNQFRPSASHRFIKALEERGRLLRNYSQNIDTLEQVAGINRVLNCHGSFATASCMRCKHQVELEFIKEDIMHERIPMCPKCAGNDDSSTAAVATASTAPKPAKEATMEETSREVNEPGPSTSASSSAAPPPAPSPSPPPRPVLKPDIVFFGESLPAEFYNSIGEDEGQADLLIVMGSSLKVQPVSLIPSSLPSRVPQILINREPLHQFNFDVCLLGDCDRIVAELCRRLGWEGVADEEGDGGPLREIRGEEVLDRRRLAYSEEQAAKTGASPSVSASASASDPATATASDTAASTTTSSASPAAAASASTSVKAAISASAAGPSSSAHEPHDHEDDCNISAYLPPGTYGRFPPNKYVFPGAEAHPDEICSDDDEDDEHGGEEHNVEDEEEEDGDLEEEEEDDDFDSETTYSSSSSCCLGHITGEHTQRRRSSQPPMVVNLVTSEEEDEAGESGGETAKGAVEAVEIEDESADENHVEVDGADAHNVKVQAEVESVDAEHAEVHVEVESAGAEHAEVHLEVESAGAEVESPDAECAEIERAEIRAEVENAGVGLAEAKSKEEQQAEVFDEDIVLSANGADVSSSPATTASAAPVSGRTAAELCEDEEDELLNCDID